MKSNSLKFFLCSCLYFVLTSSSFGQWKWLNPRPSGYLNTMVTFINHQSGFILNNNGDLYKTTNTGDTWEWVNNFPRITCMDIMDSTGVMAGYDGLLYISSDNGNSWTLVKTGINDVIETVNIVSRDTIFLSNGYKNTYSNGNIYQTFDRGKTWATLHCNTPIHAIKFINSKIGFVGSALSTILKTTDGGVSWEQKRTSNSGPSSITCMQFLNKDSGYAFQEYNSLLGTTDGGDTWQSTDAHETMNTMHFVNSKDGYLGGRDGALYATHDSGKTFTWAGFDGLRSGNDIYSVYFLSRDTGFAVGLLGRIIKTTNAGLNWLPYDSSTYRPINAISFGSATTGYAAGWNYLYKTTNKGQSWNTLALSVGVENGSQSQFTHAHFPSSDSGFVVSSYPAKVHLTFDGGNTWQAINPATNSYEYAYDLHFTTNRTGFMSLYESAYNENIIVTTTDGGITWNQLSPPGSQAQLKHIFFINQDTGYAVNFSQILKTTDGSKTWNVIYQADIIQLTSIVFTSAQKGFVTQIDGHIIATEDSGKTWHVRPLVTVYGEGIQTMNFFNKQVGYFTTTNFGPTPYGWLYQTIDSGVTWQPQKNITANSIIFTPDSNVVIAGYGGAILSSKLRSSGTDSMLVLPKPNGCGYTASAVVTAVFSQADSISFEASSQSGTLITLPTSPSHINNQRLTCAADLDSLSKDSVYTIRVKYFYDGSYRYGSSISFTYAGHLNSWLGQVSSAWEDAANWSCGAIPDVLDDVIINSYPFIYPVINSNAFCKSITVHKGATLKVNNGFKLTITGKH